MSMLSKLFFKLMFKLSKKWKNMWLFKNIKKALNFYELNFQKVSTPMKK